MPYVSLLGELQAHIRSWLNYTTECELVQQQDRGYSLKLVNKEMSLILENFPLRDSQELWITEQFARNSATDACKRRLD